MSDNVPFKPPHEVDKSGYPTEPLLRQLQIKLGGLAVEWRGLHHRGDEKQNDIVTQYHETMKRLYELGWDDILDIDAELPDKLMPQEYLRRHPNIGQK